MRPASATLIWLCGGCLWLTVGAEHNHTENWTTTTTLPQENSTTYSTTTTSRHSTSTSRHGTVEVKTIRLKLRVDGIDYPHLQQQSALKLHFEAAVTKAIANASMIQQSDVKELLLSQGSVLVQASIRPEASSFDAALHRFNSSFAHIARSVSQNVAAIPGIAAVASGSIGATVLDVQVVSDWVWAASSTTSSATAASSTTATQATTAGQSAVAAQPPPQVDSAPAWIYIVIVAVVIAAICLGCAAFHAIERRRKAQAEKQPPEAAAEEEPKDEPLFPGHQELPAAPDPEKLPTPEVESSGSGSKAEAEEDEEERRISLELRVDGVDGGALLAADGMKLALQAVAKAVLVAQARVTDEDVTVELSRSSPSVLLQALVWPRVGRFDATLKKLRDRRVPVAEEVARKISAMRKVSSIRVGEIYAEILSIEEDETDSEAPSSASDPNSPHGSNTGSNATHPPSMVPAPAPLQDAETRDVGEVVVCIGEPGEAMPAVLPRAVVAKWVKKVYARYNPKKLDRVDELLNQYRGNEAALVEAITQKYRLHPKHFPRHYESSCNTESFLACAPSCSPCETSSCASRSLVAGASVKALSTRAVSGGFNFGLGSGMPYGVLPEPDRPVASPPMP